MAQRLVRRLCPSCKQPYQADQAELELLGAGPDEAVTLWRPAGCEHCKDLGYAGRRGVYEVAVVDEGLRTLIHDDAREGDLARHAFKGRDTLYAAGLKLAREGETSLAEVLRVCRDEGERHAGV